MVDGTDGGIRYADLAAINVSAVARDCYIIHLVCAVMEVSPSRICKDGLLLGLTIPPIPVYSLTTGEAQPFATVYEAGEERHTILFVVDYGCTFCREMMAIVPKIAKTYSHLPIKLIIMDKNAEQARMMWSLEGRALPAVRVVSDIEVVNKWRIHRFPFACIIACCFDIRT